MTDFITPKSRSSTRLHNAVLELARTEAFARPLVNSGRLSMPYMHSSLNTPDSASLEGRMQPGINCADVPIEINGQKGWLLEQLGQGFTLLSFGPGASEVRVGGVTAHVREVGRDFTDTKGLVTQRYDGQPGTVYLIRSGPQPEQAGSLLERRKACTNTTSTSVSSASKRLPAANWNSSTWPDVWMI